MKHRILLLTFTATVSSAMAGLSDYTYSARYSLSNTMEASGVIYNWNTGTLFVVGDEGHAVDQYTRTGQYINSMVLEYNVSPRELRAVDDAEGIAYLGNNTFMIADERDYMGRVTTYEAGATRTLPQLTPTSYHFDPEFKYGGSNAGLEGVKEL